MKPVRVIHPITGLPCYTKHPEKLLAKHYIYLRGGQLVGREWEEHITFWNGSDKNKHAMHRPGEVRS